MISLMIIVGDKVIDLVFEIAWKEVVFKEDAVLQGLMPALDLSLCLWMARRAVNMFDLLFVQPFCEIAGDIAGAVIGQQPWFVPHMRLSTA